MQKPQQYFVSQYVPGKTDHYVFYSLATDRRQRRARSVDARSRTPATRSRCGSAAAVDNPIGSAVAFSDDGSAIEYLDNFDPVTRRGDEYVAPLAKPVRTLVGIGMHNAAFIPATTRLLYINAPDPNSGAGVLTLLPSPTATGRTCRVSAPSTSSTRASAPARTWFTQMTGAPDDGVWYMPQP